MAPKQVYNIFGKRAADAKFVNPTKKLSIYHLIELNHLISLQKCIENKKKN